MKFVYTSAKTPLFTIQKLSLRRMMARLEETYGREVMARNIKETTWEITVPYRVGTIGILERVAL